MEHTILSTPQQQLHLPFFLQLWPAQQHQLLPLPACCTAALPHAAALRALPLPAPVGTPPSGVAEVGVRRAARMSAPGGGNRRLARQVCVNQHVIQKID
jgi:hypothetical protein